MAKLPLRAALLAAAAALSGAVPGGARGAGPAEGPTPPGTLVDEVVAVLRPAGGEARVITLSKVNEEGRIALVSAGGTEAAFRPLDAMALQASLDWYIDQYLLFEEAVRLKVFEVDRADALAQLARFKEVFPRLEDYRAFLVSLDITEEELLGALQRVLRGQRYLQSRLGRHRVSDAEAASYYEGHRADFGGAPFAAVKEAARTRALEERTNADTRALLAELRASSEVRFLVDFAKGEG